ncbi:glycosyltransferase family 39 protein [Fundidesulfovibrio terrae]|uniref:glycosyltransferase family 39 protein n=1 Tax=Fundidesulfovibrio terrae TaxID=2922866 RepID=UPI001FAF22D8|nr:glycosyltransferase family 39 protein [Fundidesulfovibrio terrae]
MIRNDTIVERLVLVCILAIGAGLRFHNLGAPSMWWDEVLVPLICRFPSASILEWLRTIEVHPPLYYLLTKAVMSVDASDAALRLWSAVPGVLSIYVIHRIGKDLFGPVPGLAAAAFLAANPYAIWLSRIVRPYSLFLLVLLLSLWFLARWARAGGRTVPWGVVVCNLILFWTHYMMVILAPAFALAVLAGSWPRVRTFAAYSIASVASFATIIPFFLQNFDRPHWLGAGGPWEILIGVGESTLKLAWFFKGPIAWGVLALAAMGVLRAIKDHRGALAAALCLACLPVAVVMAGKLSWTQEPRYFLFIMPLVLLAAGFGTALFTGPDRKSGGMLAALALAAALGAGVAAQSASFYGERSLLGLDWISYKTAAKGVPHLVKPGEPVVVSEDGLRNALDWYVQREGGPNPLRLARIAPSDSETIVNFLWFGQMGHMAKSKQELAELYPGLVEVGTVDKLTFFKAVIPHTPVHEANALPWERRFAGLKDFIGACAELDGLEVSPYWGDELHPTLNGVPGHVDYVVENKSGADDARVRISCTYVNEGRGNTLRVLARFDDEPWQEALASDGPDPHFYRRAVLTRLKPFSRLTLRVEMLCPMLTAQYPGGNLGSMRLKDLLVEIAPAF